MDEKTGGGGHPQAYDTETGRYGPSTDGGGENNTPPTPPDVGRELLDFLDEYEDGKSDDELLAEDDELEEKLPEVETKVNNDALATVYNRSLQNRSFEEITNMTRTFKWDYCLNCYMCSVSCDIQLRGFDCMPYSHITRDAIRYYEQNNDVKTDFNGEFIFSEKQIDSEGNETIINRSSNPLFGGYNLESKWSSLTQNYERKITKYPLFETVYKNYTPDRTIVFKRKDLDEKSAQEFVSNIKDGERWLVQMGFHYTLLTRKDGVLYKLDRYSSDCYIYQEERFRHHLITVGGALTRVDNLEINTDTIKMFVGKVHY